jgi:mRNA interferase MazF
LEGLVKGDVVVLDYPYTNLSQFKRRPALVVAVLHGGQNVILCQITSQFKTDPDAVIITAGDFADGSLTQPVSNVRPNHLVTIHHDRILYRVGALTAERLNFVIAATVDILQRSE